MIKLVYIDMSAFYQNQEQDSQVIIEALVEENKALQEENAEKDLALQGALQRIQGLESIKEMYLGANNALLNELELYKLQETKLTLQIKKLQEENRKLREVGRVTKYFEMAEENLKLATENQQLKRKCN